MKIILSIIVLVYNEEMLIRRCLDSFINQIRKDCEIIIVDDGSNDLSPEICDEYASKYKFIKVYHKRNEGCVKSRQFGINNSKGDYIAFVDGDDYVEHEYVKNIFKVIKYNADYYMFNNKRTYFTSDKKYVEKSLKSGYYNVHDVLPSVITHSAGAVWDKLFVRKIITENNLVFDCAISYGEDVFLNVLYLSVAKDIYVSDTSSYIHIIDSPTGICEHNVNLSRLDEINRLFVSTVDLLEAIDKKLIPLFANVIMGDYVKAWGMIVNSGIRSSDVLSHWKRKKYGNIFNYVHPKSMKEKIFAVFLKNNCSVMMELIDKIIHSYAYKRYIDYRNGLKFHWRRKR